MESDFNHYYYFLRENRMKGEREKRREIAREKETGEGRARHKKTCKTKGRACETINH